MSCIDRTIRLNNSSSSLNVRSGPGQSYDVIGSLDHGETVALVGRDGNYYEIKYGSGSGYVSVDFISTSETSPSSGAGIVHLSNPNSILNVRSGPGLSSSVIGTLKHGQVVKIIGRTGGFYEIVYGTKTGYVSVDYIRLESGKDYYSGDDRGTLMGNVTYYAQTDPRWKNVMYSNHGDPSQTIGSSACGPAAVSIVMSTLTGRNIAPPEMCKLALDNGYRTYNSGTNSGFITFAANKYGIKNRFISASNTGELVNLLKTGKYMAITSMNPGHFTKEGHYIVIAGVSNINGSDFFDVYDPNNPNPYYPNNSNIIDDIYGNGYVKAKRSVFERESKGYYVFESNKTIVPGEKPMNTSPKKTTPIKPNINEHNKVVKKEIKSSTKEINSDKKADKAFRMVNEYFMGLKEKWDSGAKAIALSIAWGTIYAFCEKLTGAAHMVASIIDMVLEGFGFDSSLLDDFDQGSNVMLDFIKDYAPDEVAFYMGKLTTDLTIVVYQIGNIFAGGKELILKAQDLANKAPGFMSSGGAAVVTESIPIVTEDVLAKSIEFGASYGIIGMTTQVIPEGFRNLSKAINSSTATNRVTSASDYATKVGNRIKVEGSYSSSTTRPAILHGELRDCGVANPPYENQCHHIIPWKDPRAKVARWILDKYGIEYESAANGVFLPRVRTKLSGNATPHSGSHSKQYINTVTGMLKDADKTGTTDAVVNTLNNIREMLLEGTLGLKIIRLKYYLFSMKGLVI